MESIRKGYPGRTRFQSGNEEISPQHPNVPWADMQARRHFVVHEPFSVSEEILWDTINKDLPAMVEPLEPILKYE
ncbi:HepT-like ribonuclease domain-containing protein [Desulfatiglans anilini]|uniref:HepT-like ribonuclease domain-containing protein n=1 Tax=Desulfatiglans anilini TaxID=90728 RepID=UPI0004074368